MRTMRVVHQLERHTRWVEPKTPRSRRTIPLPSMVANELARHVASFPSGPDGSLFTGVNGRPYDHAVYGSRILGKAVAQLAVAKGSTFPTGTTTHDLRHHSRACSWPARAARRVGRSGSASENRRSS